MTIPKLLPRPGPVIGFPGYLAQAHMQRRPRPGISTDFMILANFGLLQSLEWNPGTSGVRLDFDIFNRPIVARC